MNRQDQPIIWTFFLIVALLTLGYGLAPPEEVFSDLWAHLKGSSHQWNPLLHERLPRFIVLTFSGASLAVGGAVMQSLFQNPLASPSILGISSGGSLAALLVLMGSWHLQFPLLLPAAACAGCLLALMIVFGFSRRYGGLQIQHLLLTGIALSTALIAIQGALVYALRDHWSLVQTITEWDAGSSYDRSWMHVHMLLPLALIGLFGSWYYRHEINILALGEEEACNLGVDVAKVRWHLFLCVALLTGGALAALGTIAFFGLILPHVLRRVYGPDHLQLIPICMIWGAISLSGLDLILRIFALHWLSLGTISAVLGGVFFVLLLFRQLRESPI
jgi:iron complex transport system permease protein